MFLTPVARVTTAATAGATYPQGSQASECKSLATSPLHTQLILVLYLIHMAWKKHLWSTDLALVTSVRLDYLIIFYFESYNPYLPNLGSLSHPHGLEEAPVVH